MMSNVSTAIYKLQEHPLQNNSYEHCWGPQEDVYGNKYNRTPLIAKKSVQFLMDIVSVL